LDFPTGNADRGLGTGAVHAFFPIWLQKDFGKWSTWRRWLLGQPWRGK
jgi:hypothetical protein